MMTLSYYWSLNWFLLFDLIVMLMLAVVLNDDDDDDYYDYDDDVGPYLSL